MAKPNTDQPTWGLTYDIKDTMERERRLKQEISMLQGQLKEVQAARMTIESEILKRLRISGGVLTSNDYVFLSHDGEHLEILRSHTAADVDNLVKEQSGPVSDEARPESFADACVAEMSAV